jgi:hypothetical protein
VTADPAPTASSATTTDEHPADSPAPKSRTKGTAGGTERPLKKFLDRFRSASTREESTDAGSRDAQDSHDAAGSTEARAGSRAPAAATSGPSRAAADAS